ncbi:DUF4007 family protein [Sporanaerobacter acetigenes]|uniref:DUF4007 family protein n=1 Tax=Sporanaerobacter acetigenes TaxID=165813 RepID=UPI001045FDCD|nr:DUF4007 family protein [Sporanaerobacter acetigenes]
MKGKLNSGQKFKVECPLIFKILDFVQQGKTNIDEIRCDLSIGKNKIETYNYYLRIMDLVEYEKKEFILTDFGKYILKLEDYPEVYQPLLYYKLCRGWENGGHFYYSRVVNNILYDRYFSADNCIDNSEIREKILDYKYEYENIDEKLVSTVTNGMSSSEGFGYLGVLKKEGRSKYKIYSYKPHYLVCAYILYDIWPDNIGTISFDDIIFGEYNLGRIFFLAEDDITPILSKLHQVNLIKIEDKTGLKQIAKNPNVSAKDILEEICNEYSTDTISN